MAERVDDLEACPGSDIPRENRDYYLREVGHTLSDIMTFKTLHRILPYRMTYGLRRAIEEEHEGADPVPKLMLRADLARSSSRLVRCFHGSMEQVEKSLASLLSLHKITRIEHLTVVPTSNERVLMTVVAVELRNRDDKWKDGR
ncbi:MAG: hypothetical protein GF341_06450 [candidate division Zixibacteria bacterium]|nr:hypothetical protein [candidate division Zixibacteria bacterium]